MARITVNDCLENVPNRFELVLLAAERARQLAIDETERLEAAPEARTVTALRDIAIGVVDPGELRERLIKRFQWDLDEPENDVPLEDERGRAILFALRASANGGRLGEESLHDAA